MCIRDSINAEYMGITISAIKKNIKIMSKIPSKQDIRKQLESQMDSMVDNVYKNLQTQVQTKEQGQIATHQSTNYDVQLSYCQKCGCCGAAEHEKKKIRRC
eukprot:TRINITY_DN4448_c0_g1_i2.p3 TRINITY_DN4448_c0_g1~~TRINITY_DN4448_c0_g1_i2.p3  ORF type:complete len:101 (-),score=12.05 TRINITY_DN4448_c0_g1_i2:186-488(-)